MSATASAASPDSSQENRPIHFEAAKMSAKAKGTSSGSRKAKKPVAPPEEESDDDETAMKKAMAAARAKREPVSYTHLTLPTKA